MDSAQPTPKILVNKLKTQGFFDKIRKRCLKDLDSNTNYINLKSSVDGIVSNFLSNRNARGSKIELREQLRRRLQDDTSLKLSINNMADILLSSFASPESLAPTINQMTCEALKVDYQEWLNKSKKPPPPLIPELPVVTAPYKPSPSPVSLLPKPTEPPSAPLLPDPILPTPPVKKEPLLPLKPPILAIKPEMPPVTPRASSPSDIEMDVDDYGDDMEVESSDEGPAQPVPATNSRLADTPFKTSQPSLLIQADTKNPVSSLPAVLLNSSSFSRKVSSAPRTQASSSSMFLKSSALLDDISDNEMLAGDVSPLRRRMAMAGNPVKQNSPPLPPFSTAIPSLSQQRLGGLERNPSPHPNTSRKVSPNRESQEHKHSTHHPYRDDDSRGYDSKDRDRGYDRRSRDRDRNIRRHRHRDLEKYNRGDRQNINLPTRTGIGLLERQIRNPSPVGIDTRDLLSKSPPSTTGGWRQRQSSPHSLKNPDNRTLNPNKYGGRSDSRTHRNTRHERRGRRESPHSREREKSRHRHDRRESLSRYHLDGGHRHRYHSKRQHSRESSGGSTTHRSPHHHPPASHHHGNRRQLSPVRLPSLTPPQSRRGSPPRTNSRSTDFYI